MHDIISQMIVLFILIIVGYVARKCRLMDAEGDRRLSGLFINLTCPCLILSSVMGNAVLDKSLVLPLLTEGFSTYIFLILVSWCLSLFADIRQCRFYRLSGCRFRLGRECHLLCESLELSQYAVCILHRNGTGCRIRATRKVQLSYIGMPGNDCLLFIYSDCSDGLGTDAGYDYQTCQIVR